MKKICTLLCLTALVVGSLWTNVLANGVAGGPLAGFRENKGQIVNQDGRPRTDLLYLASMGGFKVQLTRGGFSYELTTVETSNAPVRQSDAVTELLRVGESAKTIRFHRVDVSLMGANPAVEVVGGNRSSDFDNYYTVGTSEAGATKVYRYENVTYQNVYPNIDLVFRSTKDGVKYDFIVREGGNVSDIRLQYNGANGLSLNKKGELDINTSLGNLTEEAPVAWMVGQEGNRVPVSFNLSGNELSFNAPQTTGTLVIDPAVRTWSRYYGGDGGEAGANVRTDAMGNVYLVGAVGTGGASSYMATSGAFQGVITIGPLPAQVDGYIAKFDTDGNRIWGTYYGGSFADALTDLETDGSALFVSGVTSSPDIISTTGSHQEVFGNFLTDSNPIDAFLARFDAMDGSRDWGTYYGGYWGDAFADIVWDGTNIIAVGASGSQNQNINFPGSDWVISTPGAHQEQNEAGAFDIMLVSFTADGVRNWGTFYGGDGSETSTGLDVLSDGSVVIVGTSDSENHIATAGAYQTSRQMNEENPSIQRSDAVVARFSADGFALLWGTYYGGNWFEQGKSISADANDNIFVSGDTYSRNFTESGRTWVIATAGSHQEEAQGFDPDNGLKSECFLVKFDANGNRQWGTYYGGPAADVAGRVDATDAGTVFWTGQTGSWTNIATADGFQTAKMMDSDAFLTHFTADGQLAYGTYYGGNGLDQGVGIEASGDGMGGWWVHITGHTLSMENISSGIEGADFGGAVDVPLSDLDPTLPDGQVGDAFVVRFGVGPTCSDIAAPVIDGTALVCEGSDIMLMASSDGAVDYQWIGPNGFTATGAMIVIADADANDSGTYSALAVGADGCTSLSSSFDVSVNTTTIPANIIGLPGFVCINNGWIWLDSDVDGGVFSGSGVMFDGTDYIFDPIAAGPGTHTITYSGANESGCFFTSQDITVGETFSGILYGFNPTTPGGMDGSIVIGISGGAAPFEFSIDNMTWQSGDEISGLGDGVYDVFVRDGQGCSFYVGTVFLFYTPACDKPDNVGVPMLTSTTATVTWGDTGADFYEVRYRLISQPGWNFATVSTNSVDLTGLFANSIYVVQVRGFCGGNTSEWSNMLLFTTPGQGSAFCVNPTIASIDVLNNAALITWNDVADATTYRIQWKVSGVSGLWTTVVRPENVNALLIPNLMPGTMYDVRIASKCGTITLPWPINPTNFTTLPGRKGSFDDATVFSVYPNPSNGAFSVSFDSAVDGVANISVMNVTGQTVYTSTTSVETGANNVAVQLNSVAAGVYVLRLESGDAVRTAKLVIE